MKGNVSGDKIAGDAIAKIVTVLLVAGFLGFSAYTFVKPKNAGTGGQASSLGNAGGVGSSGAPGAAETKAPDRPQGSGAGGQASAGTGAGVQASAGTGAGGQASAGRAGAAGQGGASANAITVSVKTLAPETIRQMVRLNGDVSPESEVSVLPETSGRVTRIIKDLGDSVRLGDVIAWIDPSRAGVSYEANPVLSPVSGTITKLAITVGAQVTTSSEVAAVGSLDQLKLVIYVAEKYSSYLKRGLPAVVSFTAAPGEEFEASVTSVSPVVNNKNRTIETNLHLKKTDARIKDGMFAQVRLVIREESKAIVIPRASIKDYNGTDTVYVVDENGFARRVRIVLGLTNDTDAQVLEGLQAGDRVITAGAVSDGSLVRIAGSAV